MSSKSVIKAHLAILKQIPYTIHGVDKFQVKRSISITQILVLQKINTINEISTCLVKTSVLVPVRYHLEASGCNLTAW